MLTSTDFRGLLNRRFFNNLMPVPATNQFSMGTLAPAFELYDTSQKKRVKLADYTGDADPAQNRPVLLYFTRIFTEKQYCPLCFPHIKEMNERYEEFTARGAEVLMICSLESKQCEQVVRDLGLKMPLLSDPTCRVFRSYQVGQALGAPLPAQFLVDTMGKIRFRHLFSFLEPNADIQRLLVALDRVRPIYSSPV